MKKAPRLILSQEEKARLCKEAVEDVLALRPLEAMAKVERLALAGVSSKEIDRIMSTE